jgi:hypothetical protein
MLRDTNDLRGGAMVVKKENSNEDGGLVTVKIPEEVMNRSAATVLTERRPFPELKRSAPRTEE